MKLNFLFLMLAAFPACKARKQQTTETKTVGVLTPNEEERQDMNTFVDSMWRLVDRKATSIASAEIFAFVPLAPEEKAQIANQRAPTAKVECYGLVGHNETYCQIESLGTPKFPTMKVYLSKIPVPFVGGHPTMFLDKKVRLKLVLKSREIVEICRIDGVQAYAGMSWRNLNGAKINKNEDAPSIVDIGKTEKYPNCAFDE